VLETFLNSKPLFYDTIDYTRMSRAYASIKTKIKLPKIIHIIGTNGKGTTGRFLATALYAKGYRVGHYTSPHILHFNERIWFNGENVDNEFLNQTHQRLLKLLNTEYADSLSYFEYTTLVAVLLYEGCDYVVLEAGLGGEFDATAVFENILTLVTPIDIDHEAFLGETITAIAQTKLNAIQNEAIIGVQKHKEVYEVIKSMRSNQAMQIRNYTDYLDATDREKIALISHDNHLPQYLQENLSLAISALKFLTIEYSVKDFKNSRLFGRLTELSDNVFIDVGHNTLAAHSIYESLKGLRYTLVYNSYKDKNYKEILSILKPIIESVAIISIQDERGESEEVMQNVLDALSIKHTKFEKLDAKKHYLVFGSFSVVESFLKVWSE